MKKDFTQDSFEDFLKHSADGLRMKAPDRVWQNLSKELNKGRRRFAFGLSAFLLLTSAAGYYIITNASPQKEALTQQGKQQTPVAQSSHQQTSLQPAASATGAKVVLMQPKQKASFTTKETNAKGVKQLAPVIAINNKNSANEFATATEGTIVGQETFTPTVVDSYTEGETNATASTSSNKSLFVQAADVLPLSVESVINAFKNKRSGKRFETGFYFTPSISYRKLTENKSYLRSLDPALIAAGSPALYSSVNNNVTQKPDVGFELGFAAKYALSNRLKIRSGLQFNVNRYNLKAFSSSGSIATIALYTGSRIDSLQTYTQYSNLSGYKSDWLQNLYFQISAPVGVEYLVSNDDKMHFGIAATVQPTYVLSDRAYLITTDYKSYTQVPGLGRRWNVNTSLETFVGFKRWQFGPQVRYQLLSSFESKYPVKENLFDFGLKVGVKLGK